MYHPKNSCFGASGAISVDGFPTGANLRSSAACILLLPHGGHDQADLGRVHPARLTALAPACRD